MYLRFEINIASGAIITQLSGIFVGKNRTDIVRFLLL